MTPACRSGGAPFLYVRDVLRAWAPGVPGITEVLHARFTDHAYSEHAHDTWTLLVVDEGAIRYDLDRHEHGPTLPAVTLLPPFVAHTGRAATDGGFRERVLYVDTGVLDAALTGAAFGLPPHRHLTGRRVERARRLLLDGTPIAQVACLVGFHEHAHLHRHFTRLVDTTPGRFAAAR